MLNFNQDLNLSSLAKSTAYKFSDPSIEINHIETKVENPYQVQLHFKEKLPRGMHFKLILNDIISCNQTLDSIQAEPIHISITLDFYKAQTIDMGDLLISEILFNPKEGGSDFVELFNASNKILDLKDIKIGNQSVSYSPPRSYLMEPQTYWVFTKEPAHLNRDYFLAQPKQVIAMANMPSFNNDKGSLIITRDSIVLDSFAYLETMHFPMYKNFKGLSLERSSFKQSANTFGNFKSSSVIGGLASPTSANSQAEIQTKTDSVWVDKKVFSPNADGYEDELQLNYRFPNQD